MPPLYILKQKKVLIVEIAVAILIIIGGFYFVVTLQKSSDVTTKQKVEQNLTQEFLLFLDITSKNNIIDNLNKVNTLFQNQFILNGKDFTVTVNREDVPGRLDPFTP